MIYLVSYDLRKSKDCSKIERVLARYQHRQKALSCQCLVQTDQTGSQVLDALLPCIEADDGLLVTEITRNSAWFGTVNSEQDMESWRLSARGGEGAEGR